MHHVPQLNKRTFRNQALVQKFYQRVNTRTVALGKFSRQEKISDKWTRGLEDDIQSFTGNDVKILNIVTLTLSLWPINSSLLTSLLLPHLSSSLTDSLPSFNLLCLSKTDARFMYDGQKAV